METLINGYLKIKPIARESFIPTDQTMYQEIGIIVAKDKNIESLDVGDKVKFDRFLAVKFPIEGNDEEFEWFVKVDEIISSERNVT